MRTNYVLIDYENVQPAAALIKLMEKQGVIAISEAKVSYSIPE